MERLLSTSLFHTIVYMGPSLRLNLVGELTSVRLLDEVQRERVIGPRERWCLEPLKHLFLYVNIFCLNSPICCCCYFCLYFCLFFYPHDWTQMRMGPNGEKDLSSWTKFDVGEGLIKNTSGLWWEKVKMPDSLHYAVIKNKM